MSEIYRNAVGLGVALDIETATVTKVEFWRQGTKISEVTNFTTPGTAEIPYSITYIGGDFEVVWTYEVDDVEYTQKDVHSVVTPLFTAAELAAFNAQFVGMAEPKVVELERLCRNIVEGYTGQSFGYEKGTIKVYGMGDTVLLSDKRVVSIDGISVGGAPYGYLPYTYRPIKNGFGIEQEQMPRESAVFTSVAPITHPDDPSYTMFRNNVPYYITGIFGWFSVPSDVKQAALILAEEFSCREATWRDRYLKAVTAADWRFDFHNKAFYGTGSVSVDQILAKYIVSAMAII